MNKKERHTSRRSILIQGLRDRGYGIRDRGYGIRDMRYGICDKR